MTTGPTPTWPARLSRPGSPGFSLGIKLPMDPAALRGFAPAQLVFVRLALGENPLLAGVKEGDRTTQAKMAASVR